MDQTASDERHNRLVGLPIKLITWTLIAIAAPCFIYANIYQLNEQFNWDTATPTITGVVLFILTWFLWIGWGLFRLRSVLVSLMIFALPAIFLTLFYLDFGGDGLPTLRPRFWNWKSQNYSVVSSDAAPATELTEVTKYDFHQFLGPNRNLKIDNGIELSADWKTTPPELLWKNDVGDAWSGFVVANGHAVTQEQRGANECVTCYNVLTGELVWIHQVTRRHEDVMAMGKVGPRATPAIHQGRIYTTGGTGVLDCLDGNDGSLIWSANVPELVGINLTSKTNSLGISYATENSALTWGRSCSPLIYNNTVIVGAGGPLKVKAGDNDPTCTLIAFDLTTGQEVWRGGTRQISYGSPSLATINGKPQVVFMAESHAVGHDPDTGKELWAFERPGKSNADANCSQVNDIGGNRLLLTKGYRLGGEIISVKQNESGDWNAISLGKNTRLLNTKLTNPVIANDFAWSLSDGFLSCVQLMGETTLKRKWRERTRYGHGQLLAVGDKLLIHGEDGVLAIANLESSRFDKLNQIDTIEGFCWNTIAIYGDLVLVRSEREAACYRLPIKGDPIPWTISQTEKSSDNSVKDSTENSTANERTSP